MLREVHQRTMNMDLPEDVLAFLFTQLADIECVHTLAACLAFVCALTESVLGVCRHRVAHATNEKLQLSAMIGAYQRVRNRLAAQAR